MYSQPTHSAKMWLCLCNKIRPAVKRKPALAVGGRRVQHEKSPRRHVAQHFALKLTLNPPPPFRMCCSSRCVSSDTFKVHARVSYQDSFACLLEHLVSLDLTATKWLLNDNAGGEKKKTVARVRQNVKAIILAGPCSTVFSVMFYVVHINAMPKKSKFLGQTWMSFLFTRPSLRREKKKQTTPLKTSPELEPQRWYLTRFLV